MRGAAPRPCLIVIQSVVIAVMTGGAVGCGSPPRSNEEIGELRAALERDDVEVVRSWLADGLSADFGTRARDFPARGPLCDSVLGRAAAAGSVLSLRLLLEHGADPDASADSCGNTALACASADEVRAILESQGADPATFVDCKDPTQTLRVGMSLDEARDAMRHVGGELILSTPDRFSARLTSEAGSFVVRFERPDSVSRPAEVADLTIDEIRRMGSEPLDGLPTLGGYRITLVEQPD